MLFQKPVEHKRGLKVLSYGNSGGGKSWFALSFPKNAVIDTEDGTNDLIKNKNMALRLVTTSASEVEEGLEEIKNHHLDNIDTVTLDSETKIYENLQHSGLVVAETRARKNKRSAFGEGLSTKEWGKIKLIHKRINSKLIELSSLGKNIIVTAQLSDEKEKIGEDYVKIGEKPNGIKGLEYDFDIVIKICYDKSTKRRYGIIEKDRTGTFEIGDEVENPSFKCWEHVVKDNDKLKSSVVDFNKDITTDTTGFDDTTEIIKEIKTMIRDKLRAKKIDNAFVMKTLSDNGFNSPDEIEDAETSKIILDIFSKA
jgi:hypothetical protein